MDIKEKISEIVEKITKDKSLVEGFKKDPVKTVESVAGIDLPDGVVDKVVDAVKTKISADKVSGAVSGAVDAIKNLF